MSVTIKTGLSAQGSLTTDSLAGPGPIAYDETLYDSSNAKRAEVVDYIRMRLGDGIVDVELELEHYEMAIKQALIKYRQRSANAVEESYAFLDLLPETQEYILPAEIQSVRQVFRRGIGSVTGTTASQFEPFASGYLNTYMLVAGRVGGLVNYELFASYQKLAMTMFGGHINYTFNPVTRKLTIVRKIPNAGHTNARVSTLTASGTAVGSTITFTTAQSYMVSVGDTVIISNCPDPGYNGMYPVLTRNDDHTSFTIAAGRTLTSTEIIGFDLNKTKIYSNVIDQFAESCLLWVYNKKPDQMLLNDVYAFPWLQEYAYSFAKRILGEARSKFNQIAGPQGGASLNGDALKTEAQAEMEDLEKQLINNIEGNMPMTWVTG
jgi:hypothetical protein